MSHPLLKFAAIVAACELNDRNNAQMLAEGRYIPWWRRHLLFIINLGLLSPFILIGLFIVLANNLSMGFWGAFGTFLGWAIPIGLIVLGVVAYQRAERRWHSNGGTKVIEVRRDR